MQRIAKLIALVVKTPENSLVLKQVSADIKKLCKKFPIR
jgi:glycine/serine hydroxymethyltransferase